MWTHIDRYLWNWRFKHRKDSVSFSHGQVYDMSMSHADNMCQWRAIDCEGCVLLCESYLFISIVSTTVDIWTVIKVFDWLTYKHFSSLRWKKLSVLPSNSQTASWLRSDWLTAASICGLPPGITEAEIKIDVVRGWAGWIWSFELPTCS